MQPNKSSISNSAMLLDWLNFTLAAVAMGVGPFLGAYLFSIEGWTQGQVGLALSVVSFSTLTFQTPAGIMVDRSDNKIFLFAIASVVAGFANLVIAVSTNFFITLAAQILIGGALSFFAPSMAAISLGLVGAKNFADRIGRNEAFNHGGNIVAAMITGLIAKRMPSGIFCFAAGMSFVAAIVASRIIQGDIDNVAAREAVPEKQEQARIRFFDFFKNGRVVFMALCFMLFQFANAPMLVLVGQRLSQIDIHSWSVYQSWCVILSQLVMIPAAIFSGRLSKVWNPKFLMLVAFASLPVRGLLYTLSSQPKFLLAVQSIDGISSGIYGVIYLVMLRHISKGTGHFNAICGFVITVVSLGSSLSNAITGYVAEIFGFNNSMIFLSIIAMIAFVMLLVFNDQEKIVSLRS